MTERASEKPTDADLTAWTKRCSRCRLAGRTGSPVAGYRQQGRTPRREAADLEFAQHR